MAGFAQDAVIRIEAKREGDVAQAAARWAERFDDVVTFPLPRGWTAIAIGPLSPAEAGEHARRAGARRLVLTHFTDEVDAGVWAREGARGFGAPVELARGGAVYTLP